MKRLIVGLLMGVGFLVGIAGPAVPSTLAAQGAVSESHDQMAFKIGALALLHDATTRPDAYPFPISFLEGALEGATPVYRVTGKYSPTVGTFTGIIWLCALTDTNPNDDETCYAGQVIVNGQKHWTTGP